MIDFEQRGHERAERAAADLRVEAATRSLPTIGLHRRAPRRWPVLVASVTAVVGLLVAIISSRDPAQVSTDAQSTEVYAIDAEGWRVVSVQGLGNEGNPESFDFGRRLTLYSDDETPVGRAFLIQSQTSPGPAMVPASDPGVIGLRELLAGDRRLVLGDSSVGTDGWVEIDGTWHRLHSRGFTDTELVALAAAIRIDPSGPFIDDGRLPAGLRFRGAGDVDEIASVTFAVSLHLFPVDEVQVVTAVHDSDTVILYRSSFIAADLIAIGLFNPDVTRVSRGNRTAWTYGPDGAGNTVLVWEAEGSLFALSSASLSVDQLVELSLDVRQADRATLPSSAPELDPAPDGTFVASADTTAFIDVSDDTIPPAPMPTNTTVVPLALTKTLETDSELRLDGRLPDGSTFTAGFAVAADTVRVNAIQGSSSVGSTSYVDTTQGPPTQIVNVQSPYPRLAGYVAVSTDPSASYLEVIRSNGEAYRSPLMVKQGHPDLRLAVIMVPVGEFAQATVVSSDGTVLAQWGAS